MTIDKRNGDSPILDYDDGLERFVNKQALYRAFLMKFVTESIFADLKKAMEQEDYEAAFQCAHTLKGNTGNLSLMRLYEITVSFVETLRNTPDIEKAKQLYVDVEAAYEETIAYLKNIFSL